MAACVDSRNAVKFLFVALCVATFAYQMSFIFVQWRNEETAVSTEYISTGGLTLPAITICPDDAFKKNVTGLPIHTEEGYVDATYDAEDILDVAEVTKQWNMTTTRTDPYGRCYTLQSNKKVLAMSYDHSIVIKTDMTLNIFCTTRFVFVQQ